MDSQIENKIDEIESYIDECKSSVFSSNKITVDREELISHLEDLRSITPKEIEQYKRLLKNKQGIIDNATKQADAIIAEAKAKSNEMMSENQIMQQAYAKANEVVSIAQNDANKIVSEATEKANTIQMSAIGYTDALLKNVQDVLSASITTTTTRMKNYLGTMQNYLDTVNANRTELGKVLNAPDSTSSVQDPADGTQAAQPAGDTSTQAAGTDTDNK